MLYEIEKFSGKGNPSAISCQLQSPTGDVFKFSTKKNCYEFINKMNSDMGVVGKQRISAQRIVRGHVSKNWKLI